MADHFHIHGCGCFDEGIGRRRFLQGGILAAAASALPAIGQELLDADLAGSCSFYPEDKLTGEIYTFQNNDSAQ